MKIVLTGSESFVGRELRGHCRSRRIDVVGLDMVPTHGPGMHQIDIRSPSIEEVIPQGADALIHLAAVSRDQDCRKDLGGAFDINVNGTINLIQAAIKRGVKQFIFASSEWVYGNAKPDELQKEDDPVDISRMNSEYAITKIVGERLLHLSHLRGLRAATVLRFGIIYGPRPNPASAVEGIFNEVRTLTKIEMKGSLDSGRRFIHVADIARGILAAIGREGYDIFNLSGNRLITFREIINESSKILGRKPEVVATDPAALNIRNPDNTKARMQLGWQPEIELNQGLMTLMASRGDVAT